MRYCVARDIPGAFAECGVWRGGSVLAMVMTLQDAGAQRDVYLYDTFEGMTEPTERDTSALEPPAADTWRQAETERRKPWAELFDSDMTGEAAVRQIVTSMGYPSELLHLVRGPVEHTVPEHSPDGLRCCASTPIGMRPLGTSSSTCIPCSRPAAC